MQSALVELQLLPSISSHECNDSTVETVARPRSGTLIREYFSFVSTSIQIGLIDLISHQWRMDAAVVVVPEGLGGEHAGAHGFAHNSLAPLCDTFLRPETDTRWSQRPVSLLGLAVGG